MKFIERVMSQKLSETEQIYAKHLCQQPWKEFSSAVGMMNKTDSLKLLKYIATERPSSTTLGKRVVQRFNSLNKVKWEELVNGRKIREGTQEED